MATDERQAKAMELRKHGVTYDQIAKELGFSSPSGAYEAVKAGLAKMMREPADELRTMELARLDSMLEAIAENVVAGDLDSIGMALRISERRGRLLGLERKDTPITVKLPKLEKAQDAVAVVGALIEKVTVGEISPDDANRIAGLLGTFIKSAEATEIAEKLARLEELAVASAEKEIER